MENSKFGHDPETSRNQVSAAWVVGRPLPTGTVTFLFTDIVGSTPLWESEPELMSDALQIHNTVLRQAIEANGGAVFKTVGDAFQAAFPTALDGLKAAIAGQRALQTATWNELGELKVRMGLHTGEAQLDPGGDEYAVSHTKNRIGRIHAIAHGGQILISAETSELVDHQLPPGITLKDIGEHQLKGMQWTEHLYQVNAPELPDDFPSLATALSHPNNLPVQLTTFIGRKKESGEVVSLLRGHRLVTLTGSGGVGKTRLSLRGAETVLDDFPDGVWYIELAPLADPKLVPQTVALTIGLREDGGRTFEDVLLSFMKSRQALIVLDNCEHLLVACARLTAHLLQVCPQLKILASSREALGVPGEVIYHVPSLNIPGSIEGLDPEKIGAYDAVSLFVERARDVIPSFETTKLNAPHIARICQRLDGIPLALELASARLKMLTTEQLASRLDHAFRLLTGGARTALPRQQTLRATVDWSYQLLDESEQTLLRRLAVFAGGWTLEGSEGVCAGDGIESWEIFDLLASLVDKSIVVVEREQGRETRYRLLEIVRQFAREKLFDTREIERLRNKHLEYYVQFADRAEPQLHGAGRPEWTQYIKTEHANIREAIEWAYHDPSTVSSGLRIATAISYRFWFTQGYIREGSLLLKNGLEVGGKTVFPRLRAKALLSLGMLLPFINSNQAHKVLDICITLCSQISPDADREWALALTHKSLIDDDRENAFDSIKEAERKARICQPYDPWTHTEILWFYSRLLFGFGYDDLANKVAQESVQLAQSGDRWLCGGYWVLGMVALKRHRYSDSIHHFKTALDLVIEVGDKMGIAVSLIHIGIYHRLIGNFFQSYLCYQEVFKQYDVYMGFRFDWLASFGLLLVDNQRSSPSNEREPAILDAVRLFSAYEHWKQEHQSEYVAEKEMGNYPETLRYVQENAEFESYRAAWEDGTKLAESVELAAAYALSIGEKYSFQDSQEKRLGGANVKGGEE